MIHLFTTASRYLCILLTVLYTYCNFRYLSLSDEEAAEQLAAYQKPILLLFHFLLSLVLILHSMRPETLGFYFAQLLFLLLFPWLFRRLYRNVNPLLLNNMSLLLAVGLVMLERLSLDRAVKQYAIVLAAGLLSLPVPYLIDRIWDFARFRTVLAAFGIALLSSVLLIGVRSYGAKMSISLGGFSFQAVELVKLSFVFSLAGFLYRAEALRDFLVSSLVAALHILLLVLCKDLGSALLLFLCYLVMLYIATRRTAVLTAGLTAAGFSGVLSYFLFSHVRTRVFAWRNPWADINNRGYQITQSLFAIGTGGFFGLGLYQGLPNKIPIVEKDFIISAVSEELGAVVAICLTLICLGCFLQMMMIATYMEFGFYKLVAVGLAIQYVMQVFLTIGGAVKFIPSTGVTLPFVSYGGSSLFSSFLLFAVIQALYIVQGNEDEAELLTETGEAAEDTEYGEQADEERTEGAQEHGAYGAARHLERGRSRGREGAR